MALEARQAALKALDWVLREGRMLAHLPADPRLSPGDAARAARLASLTLRHVQPLDAVIAPYLDRKPPLPALNILRLAAAELLVAGGDAHGVVDSAVKLAKARRPTQRMAGMVNAVLRKVAVEGPERFAAEPPQRLPGWIGGPVKKRWGAEVLRTIEAAHVPLPPIDLTVKPGATVEIEGATRLPTGSLRLPAGTQVSAVPGYATGDVWVQDAAAALPVRLMGNVAGARVLDLCAAPGGKAMQLAALGAHVTAVDLSDSRMGRVRENLARTGLTAELVVADALDYTAAPFDAILLDAPCTASGTIRRHPDLPHVKSWTEVEPLTRLQMRLLDHALTLLKPGGTLVYCTCSLLPVEGEHQITAALKRHDGLCVIPADPVALGGDDAWRSPEGGLRLRPDMWAEIGGLDGFYMAALTRP
ncbi:RsmB/NOP family class I SAM-dependent RNA methyltransferase [Roseicyclus persicicus]|uniref:Methyltransferase domain-containing protein n=1 Tax=Roseicyclus persicicus TaxID=2650661 RepID=A0A7X6H056_9RHOB|nr:RsmB/NOP family class I SAM-dependent RNA methyltransferase [Roseibacterium persicicum]NKX45543.1 methyltransferase domain-containing protein [Roseibacterium persicicum]